MDNRTYDELLLKIIKLSNEINYNITNKQINSLQEIKKNYLNIKSVISQKITDEETITIDSRKVPIKKELDEEIEKLYSISIKFFRTLWWGNFAKINPKRYPELSDMMVDKDGELLRIFDDFRGTVAVMDFHGYTQFSNDVKYNKTPLAEFGNVLPQKIDRIAELSHCIVYEVEGDALILIGPENPVFIMNAVLCITELCRQKPLKADANPKDFHGIDLKNPLIQPFEMNASITTGGETFINNKGNVIGTIISEAARILKIINEKKTSKSGIMISEKTFRRMEKYKDTKTGSHLNVFDFMTSVPVLVDVKGMRLNIREIFIEEKYYSPGIEYNVLKLIEEIRKKTSLKWYNILIQYVRVIQATIKELKVNITIGNEEYNMDKVRFILEQRLDNWAKEADPQVIRDILKIGLTLFSSLDEVRDSTAIFHEYIQENFTTIAEKLEFFYGETLKKEENSSPGFKRLMDNYHTEMKKLKNRVLPKRIIETILTDSRFSNTLLEVPYMGKK